MRATIAFDQAKAEATLQGDMPDGSGVGVNYVDVIAKASKLTLPDGRKLLLKRKGLQLTLDRRQDGRGAAAPPRPRPRRRSTVRKGIEEPPRKPRGQGELRAGALHLDID